MADQQHSAVFCYAYFDYAPEDPAFAGFAVNLYQDDTLTYCTYDVNRMPMAQSTFVVSP